MKIYANGCSFTFGDELTSPSEDAWPIVLAKKLKSTIHNDAVSGGTNYRTMYRTIKNLNKNFDFYLIAWTSYARFTFYKSDNNFEVNFNPGLVNLLYGKEKFYKEWGKIFYQYWFNELYAFKLWLQQIIQLQSLLQGKKYIMINTMDNNLNLWLSNKINFIESVKSLINFDAMDDHQIFDEYNEISYYISLIDFSNFYKWNEFYIVQLKDSFSTGPGGHILEEGHRHLANLVYDHLCSK